MRVLLLLLECVSRYWVGDVAIGNAGRLSHRLYVPSLCGVTSPPPPTFFDSPSLALIMLGIDYVIASLMSLFAVAVLPDVNRAWTHCSGQDPTHSSALSSDDIWCEVCRLAGLSSLQSQPAAAASRRHFYIFPKLELYVRECAAKQDITLKNLHCLWSSSHELVVSHRKWNTSSCQDIAPYK